MRTNRLALSAVLLAGCHPVLGWEGLDYPGTVTCDQVDDFFGTPVPDPYRWLEEIDSPATAAWILAQNALTDSVFAGIPDRDPLRARLGELEDYGTRSMPFRRGDRYFFTCNSGLQEHDVLCSSESLGSPPVVVLDPNLFPEADNLSLAGVSISDDGRTMAWGLSANGSDWVDWYVTDLGTGRMLDDTLRWTKTGWVSWNADGTGFYYARMEAPGEGEEYTGLSSGEEIWLHRVGTDQDSDSLVFARPDHPEWFLSAWLTDDHRYLLFEIYDGNSVDHSGLFYVDMGLPPAERRTVELLGDFDASYGFIGNLGTSFCFLTNLDAPRNRIIVVDVENPGRENWRTLVPEGEDVLESASILDGSRSLVLQYSRDVCSVVRILGIDGTFRRELELPGPGTVWGFGGRQDDTETFYQYSSLLSPGIIFRYDFATDSSTVHWAPETGADLTRFRTGQVFYESADGTRIPMFLAYPADIELDGTNPVLLTGYGGFGVPMSPWYSSSTILWLEQGGVFAQPCIRGGGEYGEAWHLAGIRGNRIRVYEDFIAAAEYLIREGWTSTPHLGILGGSNGGTLIAACLNLRPDLFGAAIPEMGVLDQLRYPLFTYGWCWIPEYGDPQDPEDFGFLYGLSPYHNIREGVAYPPVLVSTADHDDRVVPGHSFKYAARLQAAQAGDAPILIRIHEDAGHGGAVGLSEALDRTADDLAFLLWAFAGNVESAATPP